MISADPGRAAQELDEWAKGLEEKARSFQTMSPLAMVEAVAKTGKRAIATLHPNGDYSADELAALEAP